MSPLPVISALRQDRCLHWLLRHASQLKRLLASLMTVSFADVLLAGLTPVFIGSAFNAVLAQPPNTTQLAGSAIGIIASQIIRASLRFGRVYTGALLGERMAYRIREELYTHLLNRGMAFHEQQATGDLMTRATNDVHEVNLMFYEGVSQVIGSTNFAIIPLILSSYYHPTLILAPLLFILLYVQLLVPYLDRLRPVADQVRHTFGLLNSFLIEVIEGIELVKGAAQETKEIARFGTKARQHQRVVVRHGSLEARFLPFLLLGMVQGLGFLQALILYRIGAVQVGDVVAYMGLLFMLGAPTFVGVHAFSRVSVGMAAARRIESLLRADTLPAPMGHQGTLHGHLAFEQVSFGYNPGETVLRDINFSIQAGQTLAIVGSTGSGKTSLAKLVNRMYDVGQGRILIDNIDVRDWDIASLRRQIAVIEQEVFLFSRTIAENIAFGRTDATPEMIEEASRLAQIHDFIAGLQNGYQTLIGERGVNLSGGQKQLVALARAFLTRPRLLILDDSTSAVDSDTEGKIQRALIQGAARCTTLLITYRLSQIRRADRVLVLDKGRIESFGTHDELMRQCLKYRRIFELLGEGDRAPSGR